MVLRCSWRGENYDRLIGKVIQIHYFSTFGAWDKNGRWFYYYDLSIPISFWKHPLIYLGLAGIPTTQQFRKKYRIIPVRGRFAVQRKYLFIWFTVIKFKTYKFAKAAIEMRVEEFENNPL